MTLRNGPPKLNVVPHKIYHAQDNGEESRTNLFQPGGVDVALSPDFIKANVDPSHHQRATPRKVNSFPYEPLVPNPMSGMLLHTPTVPIPRFEPKEPPPWRREREDK